HWWRVAHAGTGILRAVGCTRRLWVECVWHSTGAFQCQAHRCQLALPPGLRATRTLLVTSCSTSLLACAPAAVGTCCAQGSPAKAPLAASAAYGNTAGLAFVLAGLAFVLAGLLCLVPVSWSTNEVIRDFYQPTLPAGMKYEMGQALYLGFASALLTILGGTLLCVPSCGRGHEVPLQPHSLGGTPSWRPPDAPKGNHAPSMASASHSGYRLSDYV
ncbi:CLD14 protein, partial [Scytalopus superciliaris]|nr:CLD14 protein [Scytalopus superciliaris]